MSDLLVENEGSWVTDYTGLDEILDDEALIAGPGKSAHRIGPDGKPACGFSAGTWHRVEIENIGVHGCLPCGICYRPVAMWLADRDDNPVEYVGDSPMDEIATDDELGVIADGGNASDDKNVQLGSLTEEVLTANGSNTIHAPAANDEPVCSSTGDFRRVDRAVMNGHGEPCAQCFDTEALEADD